MQLFCANPTIFSKKFQIIFLPIKTLKNWDSKVAHEWHKPCFSQSSPAQPTIQNWFFMLWICPKTHLFSYLWFLATLWGPVEVFNSYSRLEKMAIQMKMILLSLGKFKWKSWQPFHVMNFNSKTWNRNSKYWFRF